MEDLVDFWRDNLPLIEKELKKSLSSNFSLSAVMRYSTLNGGKRVRPLLALATCRTVGGKIKEVLPAACALELIHTFSLIHDDLPALDNDDLRRGKLACHKKFGEAIAILAGDALLNRAFELLSEKIRPKMLPSCLKEITSACGTKGMIGGQVLDILTHSKSVSSRIALENIYRKKTGALFKSSVRLGALLSGATRKGMEVLEKYGENIGLAFQISDDLIDYQQEKKKDQLNYPRLYGVQSTKKRIVKLTEKAKEALKFFGPRAKLLSQFADLIANRKK